MKNIFFLIMLFILGACSSQQPISRADFSLAKEDQSISDGIIYNLPSTIIKVEITATETVEKKGPYYRYSQRFLNLTDIITEDKTYWTINGAKISTSSIPDPDRTFYITSEGTPSGAAVNLTPDGILKGLNLSGITKKTLEEEEVELRKPESTDKEDMSFNDIPFTEEQLIKTSSAATAEEVAAEIYRLRDARRRLIESDMQKLPPDNGAYERLLKEIDRLESQYLSLFRGKRQTTSVTKTFTFLPDPGQPANQVLCRFSSQKGFTNTIDMSGTPVYIEVQADTKDKEPDLPQIDQTQKEEKERSGLYYCRPAKATVKIIDRTVLLNEKEILVGQFGSMHQLPASLLDNPDTAVKMDSKTGAILEIKTK
ncbi:DUF4831 family protein [Marinilabilia rubra]|uniref:DUF4831 domain-containing protein n=1 Tax=Marinilabilia rubra TaxID=2162893 RepID=A0A2U2B462_9BACT|nr:DUF4831 family protein [Marinilabilia rubra]PWD97846.1 DUF4831 domain-containing protein [Marinilabilia rubra]